MHIAGVLGSENSIKTFLPVTSNSSYGESFTLSRSLESFVVDIKNTREMAPYIGVLLCQETHLMPKNMNVTEPFLPPLSDFVKSLEQIWDSKWLTNNGKFHQELEFRLAEYLGVPFISLFANGTIALVTAMQALRLSGEVITTPYSFVATAHSLLWNNLIPVFCDIDPNTFNISPERIEQLITPRTTAILPVHCYGFPCDVKGIQDVADRYGLKVIYDAAHAFGVRSGKGSILNCGDLSVLSFHATKVFNTIEGGAVVSQDAATKARIDYLKNFGFADEVTVVAPGINGKMNELQAAFGLHQLDHIDEILERRRYVDELYRGRLNDIGGLHIPNIESEYSRNYSYFPVLVGKTRASRDGLHQALVAEGIRARRYFYPLISNMPMYRGLQSAAFERLESAADIADRVLCLPIHPNLSATDVSRVCDTISSALPEVLARYEISLPEEPASIAPTWPEHEIEPGGTAQKILSAAPHKKAILEKLLLEVEPVKGTQIGADIDEPDDSVHSVSAQVEMEAEPFSLSIIIPVYRAEKYLATCLDSVLACESTAIDIVAVDDGSPDGSGDILASYADRYDNVKIITQENRGGAAAINRGLREAKGQYVMILDCDDWLDSSAIEILKYEAETSRADIIAGRIVKTYSSRMEPAYDTAYIVRDETVSLDQRLSLLQDGMYLGKIFRKSLLETENLWMDPTLLYADRPFVNVAMAVANSIRLVTDDVYYWRQREDPENLSATDKMHHAENLRDRVRSIRVIRDELKARGKGALLRHVDEQNLKRLFWHFERRDPKSLRAFGEIVRPYVRLVDLARNKNLTEYQRALSKLILDTKPKNFPAAYYSWVALRKLKSYSPRVVARSIKDAYKATKHAVDIRVNGTRMERISKSEMPDPIMVVFESFFGKSYGGQPRYIYEELLRSGKAFRAIWIFQGKEKLKGIPGNAIQVHRGTTEYFHYLARARYWVNNIRFTVTYKPPQVTYLQTWHGTPLKRLGLDIEASGPEADVRKSFLKEASLWDYLVAANQYSEEHFASAFAYTGKFITGGYPANDILLDPVRLDELSSRTREELAIPSGKKIIMYAPTWRDDAKIGKAWAYSFQLKMDLKRMRAELGDEYVLLLRAHHLIADQINLNGVEDFVFDVSRYNDPTALMAITDLLISDYSSIMFDFACLSRPMIFYMYDLQKYSSNLRGFYFDPKPCLPGPIVSTFSELLEEIKKEDGLMKKYAERMNKFREKFCSLDDGCAAKRIVSEVFSDLPFIEGGARP